MPDKVKLSFDEQITHMRDVQGIKFEIVGEEEAKVFLSNNNYYFKIKSYAKCFEKYHSGEKKGKYRNLDFAFLQELSTLDFYFRRLLLKMTLDIEHFLKTKLLRDFTENSEEDGYLLVDEFLAVETTIRENLQERYEKFECLTEGQRIDLTGDVVIKYTGHYALWNIVEVLSFGEFLALYRFYYQNYPRKDSKVRFLWEVRCLRNAAAHNNCIFNNIKQGHRKINPNQGMYGYVNANVNGVTISQVRKMMKNPVVHDFITLLYVFTEVVSSEKMRHYTMIELKDLFGNRFLRNKGFYAESKEIVETYSFVKKSIDHFSEKCIIKA